MPLPARLRSRSSIICLRSRFQPCITHAFAHFELLKLLNNRMRICRSVSPRSGWKRPPTTAAHQAATDCSESFHDKTLRFGFAHCFFQFLLPDAFTAVVANELGN
jgi:hypothetical protein